MDVEEGARFGPYELVGLLGRGGLGEVWRARDTATDRVVALKLSPANVSHDRTFQERFRREAQAAAGLNNPHVIPIHTYGEIDGRLFVDMRLIDGRDLQSVLAGGPLEPARAVRIVDHVARALTSAHRIGLIHRDVKPSNILLDGDDYAYLIDFGISQAANETGLTGTNALIGSWHYMAPERFGVADVDHRSDVYSLACVLYECLAGIRPFPGDTLEQQYAGHVKTPPPTLAGPLAAFNVVIARGMAKEPAARYDSVGDLASAAQDPLASNASPPTPPAVLEDRPRRILAVVAPVLLALVLAATSAAAVVATRVPPPTAAPAEWIPYVDAASTYVENTFTYTQQTIDSQVDVMVADSTGPLRAKLVESHANLRALFRDTGASSACTVNAAGVESLAGTDAKVLVAVSVVVTGPDGVAKPAQPYRLRLDVTRDGDRYLVADLTYPDGTS